MSNAYQGMSTLLVRNAADVQLNEDRLRAALVWLMDPNHGNPLVRQVLTCYEREKRRLATDQFPAAAGSGAVPILQWDSHGAPAPVAATILLPLTC